MPDTTRWDKPEETDVSVPETARWVVNTPLAWGTGEDLTMALLRAGRYCHDHGSDPLSGLPEDLDPVPVDCVLVDGEFHVGAAGVHVNSDYGEELAKRSLRPSREEFQALLDVAFDAVPAVADVLEAG